MIPNSSCFGFPIICKDLNLLEKLKYTLEKHGFQTRPIVTGNILRHPVSRFSLLQKNYYLMLIRFIITVFI